VAAVARARRKFLDRGHNWSDFFNRSCPAAAMWRTLQHLDLGMNKLEEQIPQAQSARPSGVAPLVSLTSLFSRADLASRVRAPRGDRSSGDWVVRPSCRRSARCGS